MLRTILTALLIAAPVVTIASEADKEAIFNMFQRHDQALNQQDIEAVMATFTDDPVVLGTGLGERWVGREEVTEAYRHFFADFDKGSLERECTWRKGGIVGDAAWIVAECGYTDHKEGASRKYALNVSGVFIRQAGGDWRIQSMHFSNLISRP
jgi:uncharacterized protein (TIGR02246 family)